MLKSWYSNGYVHSRVIQQFCDTYTRLYVDFCSGWHTSHPIIYMEFLTSNNPPVLLWHAGLIWIFYILDLMERLTLYTDRISNGPCEMRSGVQGRHPSPFTYSDECFEIPLSKCLTFKLRFWCLFKQFKPWSLSVTHWYEKNLRADFGGNQEKENTKGKRGQ